MTPSVKRTQQHIAALDFIPTLEPIIVEATLAASLPRQFLIGSESHRENSAINLVSARFNNPEGRITALPFYGLEISQKARQ